MGRLLLTIFLCLIYVQANADVIVTEKQGGVEQKVLISGDKVQVRKRMDAATVNAGMSDRIAGVKEITGSKSMFDAFKERYARSKGTDVATLEKQHQLQAEAAFNTEMRNLNLKRDRNGKLAPADQARYDELMAKKKERETLTADGETVAAKKGREQAQTALTGMEAKQGELAKEAVDKSLQIETYRFDRNRYYVVKPAKGTYTETTITEEKERRGKKARKSSGADGATAELKATGEKETVNGQECEIYLGTLTMRGRALAADRLCIFKTSGDVAVEYWRAQNRLLLEIGPTSPNPLDRLFALAPAYYGELAKLPGIPLKRTMNMTRGSGVAAGNSFVTETAIVSTDKIDPAEFELPKGLKKE